MAATVQTHAAAYKGGRHQQPRQRLQVSQKRHFVAPCGVRSDLALCLVVLPTWRSASGFQLYKVSLYMASANEILVNAERLISDAEHLFADGRSRSASTLIVVALEQMGAFVEAITASRQENASNQRIQSPVSIPSKRKRL